MKVEDFILSIKEAVDLLKSNKNVLVIHHDDADGICSAAILKESLKLAGFETRFLCLEKLFPEVIKRVHETFSGNVVYADIGSPHVRLISKLNQGKNLVIILDHHDTEDYHGESVLNINPELFSMKGEVDASGSTVCYFFAKTLDEKNVSLSYLALIGSCEIPIGFKGLNEIVLEDAKNNRIVDENLFVKELGMSVKDVFRKLQILGPVGYYENGPSIGIHACLNGFDEKTIELVDELEEKRKKANRRMLAILYRTGLREKGNVQWFHAKNLFSGMGTKVIGTFCSYLSYQRFVDAKKYIIGFMNMSREIPGFGELSKDYVKVSARVPRELKKEIDAGKKKPLSFLLPEACKEVGGFGDGHAYAASGVIPMGKEEEFIEVFENLSRS